ncbi:MAG TPA: hypothetical protein VKX25_13305 [Bryobacteraceae bacterium]|jgi:hypothetical protein|nr:hypothetical protein [Bryobacteraceae bacterium]
MPGRGPQTFKKRQKEQERKERRQEKLAKRLAKKDNRGTESESEVQTPLDPDNADVKETDDQPEPLPGI